MEASILSCFGGNVATQGQAQKCSSLFWNMLKVFMPHLLKESESLRLFEMSDHTLYIIVYVLTRLKPSSAPDSISSESPGA